MEMATEQKRTTLYLQPTTSIASHHPTGFVLKPRRFLRLVIVVGSLYVRRWQTASTAGHSFKKKKRYSSCSHSVWKYKLLLQYFILNRDQESLEAFDPVMCIVLKKTLTNCVRYCFVSLQTKLRSCKESVEATHGGAAHRTSLADAARSSCLELETQQWRLLPVFSSTI